MPAPAFPPGDPAACPVERTLRLLGGRWRLMVLFRLGRGEEMRWGALRRALAPVTPKVLTATLRGLEVDGLVWRRDAATVPPEVAYGLTPRGAALAPVFAAMADWGLSHAPDAADADAAASGPPPADPASAPTTPTGPAPTPALHRPA